MLLKNSSKIIPLLFLFICTSSLVNAQIKIGLNGGTNFAKYTIDGTTSEDLILSRKTGFSISAISEYQISKYLTVRLNGGYIQRGGKNVFGVRKNTLYFDYLELSPYLTYNVINSEIIVKIIGGLSFGRLINAKFNTGGNDFSLKESLYLFNIASNFGLEIEKKIWAKTSLIINGIYSVGLKNISKTAGAGIKTSDFNLNVGFLYSL